jgi:predicted nucleic-acid-binding Zn-ribbon protein
MAEEDVSAIPGVASDLPCPKCLGDDVSLRYCDSCRHKLHSRFDLCRHGDPEHFHRTCRRCGYEWRTDDLLQARVVCDR